MRPMKNELSERLSARQHERAAGFRRLLLTIIALVMALSCKADEKDAPGQLMVVLQTDMSVPKGVDMVRVQVRYKGELKLDSAYRIKPNGRIGLPGTVAVVAGDDPSPTVQVTVIGVRESTKEARTFSRVTTTIPKKRVATVYVPVQWLCDGVIEKEDNNDDITTADFSSGCPEEDGVEQACKSGTCQPVEVPEEELPSYRAEEVYGGGPEPGSDLATCFPTEECFDRGFDVLPDSDCQVEFEVPANHDPNLGLTVPKTSGDSDGACGETGCYVPLDKSETLGWYERSAKNGGRLIKAQLPKAVCRKLVDRSALAVRASVACTTKTPQTPTCGRWAAVKAQPFSSPIVVGGTSGVDGGVPFIPTDEELPAVRIVIDEDGAAPIVPIDGTLQLSVQLAESDSGSVGDIQLAWSSDAPEVAEVDDNGVVTGVATGEATITVEYGASQTATFAITVVRGSPQEVTIEGAALDDEGGAELPLGEQIRLEGFGSFAGDDTENLTESAEWSTSDASVATVENGLVTTVGEGEAEITVTFDGVESQSVTIVVTAAELEQIVIVQDTEVQVAEGSVALRAFGKYTNTEDATVDITDQVTWGSEDETIAVVSEDGIATGVGGGTTNITATLDGIIGSVPFTVEVTDADGAG